MFLLSAHHLARSVVIYLTSAEDWLWVRRTKRREFLEISVQMLGDVAEVYLCINVEYRFCLFW